MFFYTFCQENLPRTMPFQYCRVRSLNPHKYLKIKMYELSSSLPVMRCSTIHHTLLVYFFCDIFFTIYTKGTLLLCIIYINDYFFPAYVKFRKDLRLLFPKVSVINVILMIIIRYIFFLRLNFRNTGILFCKQNKSFYWIKIILLPEKNIDYICNIEFVQNFKNFLLPKEVRNFFSTLYFLNMIPNNIDISNTNINQKKVQIFIKTK